MVITPSQQSLGFRFLLLTGGIKSRSLVSACLPQLVARGLKAIQLREPDLSQVELLDCVAQWKNLIAPYSLSWWVNGSIAIALQLELALHLPERFLPPSVKLIAQLKQLSGWSCAAHSARGLTQAAHWGATFTLLAPIFPTPSKPNQSGLGLKQLAELCKKSPLPVIALGGITPENALSCLHAGAAGVAVISAIWEAPNPAQALLNFQAALGSL